MAGQLIFTLYTVVDGIFVARGVSEIGSSCRLNCYAVRHLAVCNFNNFRSGYINNSGSSSRSKPYYGGETRIHRELSFTCFVVDSNQRAGLYFPKSAVQVARSDGIYASICKELSSHDSTVHIYSVISYNLELLLATDGFPGLATIYVLLGVILNILLDWYTIFKLNWGIVGAGLATSFSQTVVIIIYLIHFAGRKATLRFTRFVQTRSHASPIHERYTFRYYGNVAGNSDIYLQQVYRYFYAR